MLLYVFCYGNFSICCTFFLESSINWFYICEYLLSGKQEKAPTHVVENANAVKESGAGKKVKIVEPKKDVKAEEDEDSSDDSDAMSEDESDSEEVVLLFMKRFSGQFFV